MKAQQPKALVLLMGVRDMRGARPPGDPQPYGSIQSHVAPMPTASAKPHALCGLISSIPQQLQQQSPIPSPAGTGAEELCEILLEDLKAGSSRSQREMAEPWGSHQAMELLSHLPTASAASGELSHPRL